MLTGSSLARVRKVVVGIHDPNRDVTGKGFLRLQEAGIETELFPNALAQRIKGLNDEFIRAQQSLGIVIDKSIAQNGIKLTEKNVLHIKGKWINPPDNADIVRVIVQHDNIWWPQPKPPTPVGASREDWTSEVTIGATGLHKIIIGKVNPLGKALFDYYWRVIEANKQKFKEIKKLNPAVNIPEGFTNWVGIDMKGDSPPKGIDQEDRIEVNILELAPKK